MATNKQLYNEDIKEQFLSQYKDDVARQYRYCLYRAFETEDMLERDLFTFNTEEIKDALFNANHKSFNSVNLTFSVFRNYINWAASNGYAYSNINVIESIGREELKKLVHEENLYVTIDDLRKWTKELKNAQDIACIWLPFEGVSGFKASEMINLMYNNINWNTNELSLQDDKYGQRKVTVTDECLSVIKSAYQEETYIPFSEDKDETPLIRNDYIIRNTRTRRTKNINGVSEHTIYSRLGAVRKFLEIPKLAVKLLEKSGKIYMASRLFQEHGELTREHYKQIAEQFGVRPVIVDGEVTYNYSLLYQVIDRDIIFDLYNVDIES